MLELEGLSADSLEQALDFIVFDLGSGKPIDAESIQQNPTPEKVAGLLEACPLKPHGELELMTGCLADHYQKSTDNDTALEKFLQIDEQLSSSANRNQLQDRLLAAYAEACGIDMEEAAA